MRIAICHGNNVVDCSSLQSGQSWVTGGRLADLDPHPALYGLWFEGKLPRSARASCPHLMKTIDGLLNDKLNRLLSPHPVGCPLNTSFPFLWLLLNHPVLVAQFSLMPPFPCSFPLLHFLSSLHVCINWHCDLLLISSVSRRNLIVSDGSGSYLWENNSQISISKLSLFNSKFIYLTANRTSDSYKITQNRKKSSPQVSPILLLGRCHWTR